VKLYTYPSKLGVFPAIQAVFYAASVE